MNAEERLEALYAGDRRRQARRRDALREKGLTQTNVWVPADLSAIIEREIQSGRFNNRSEAITWALTMAFKETQ